MSEITIIETKPQLVLGIRKTGEYKMIPELIKKVFLFIQKSGAKCVGTPMFLCHEMSAEEAKKAMVEKNADLEITVPVAERVEGDEEIKCYEMPGTKMVKALHLGPYEECEPTYNKVFKWIEDNGYCIDVDVGYIIEKYLNDPREVSKEEIATEILIPIK